MCSSDLQLNASGSIVPTSANTYDLGSPGLPFRHLYVSSGSVYLNDNQILTLDLEANTTLISPSNNSIRFINDVIFDAINSGSNVGGQMTMQGQGPAIATQTSYVGDFHFINTNGYYLMSNKLPGMDAGSGSINIVGYDTGSINISTDYPNINIESNHGQITQYISGSGNIRDLIVGNNSGSHITQINSASVVYNNNSIQKSYSYHSAAQSSDVYLYGSQGSVFNIGAIDYSGNTFDTEFRLVATAGQMQWQDWNNSTSGYTSWMTQQPNNGDNPRPSFTRGIIVSGSLNVSGSANIQSQYIKLTGSIQSTGGPINMNTYADSYQGPVVNSNATGSANNLFLLYDDINSAQQFGDYNFYAAVPGDNIKDVSGNTFTVVSDITYLDTGLLIPVNAATVNGRGYTIYKNNILNNAYINASSIVLDTTNGLSVNGDITANNNLNVTQNLNLYGNQTFVSSGANQSIGTATLNGANPATVTVSNNTVSTNSIILLTKQTANHTNGSLSVSKTNGSFTIHSSHNGDTDVVGWMIIQPI